MSVRLKSRQQSPINGFQFVQPEISPNPMKTWDFRGLVDQVINQRRANPRFQLPTERAAVENEVDEQNAMRMLSIRGGENYITHDALPAPPPFYNPPQRRRAVAAAGDNLANGVRVLADWLGEGGVPVAKELAESRAAICAVCPKNGKGDWTARFTGPVAAVIRKQLAIKNDMSLTTAHDNELGVCDACGCQLSLKVWAPIKHIAAHLTDEVKAKLDPGCWVTSELCPK
jgi:hypothetical protein